MFDVSIYGEVRFTVETEDEAQEVIRCQMKSWMQEGDTLKRMEEKINGAWTVYRIFNDVGEITDPWAAYRELAQEEGEKTSDGS